MIALTSKPQITNLLERVIEIKAVISLEDVHLAQAKNYVIAYKFEKGLLINFGAKSLEYEVVLTYLKTIENIDFRSHNFKFRKHREKILKIFFAMWSYFA